MMRSLPFGLTMALAGVMLTACGFTPLYGRPGVTAGLSGIEVVAPEGRVGFLLRQSLDDDLGHDKTAPAPYRLEITLAQTRGPRGLTRTDVADYYDIGLTVHYTLVRVATGMTVATGDVASQVSYDDTGQVYADIAAAQNADSRLASDAARRLEIKLAAWMARQSAP